MSQVLRIIGVSSTNWFILVSVSFVQDIILCLEMEEEHAPGDLAGEGLPLVDEVKVRVRPKPLTL